MNEDNDFFCDECGKYFNKKYNLERHKNKKYCCKQQSIIIQNIPKKSIHDEKKENIIILDNTNQNIVNFDDNNKLNKHNDRCPYCSGIFSNKSNLNKHIKINCKIKKQQDDEKENIFQKLLLQEGLLKKKDEQINKLINQNDVLINKINVLEEKVDKISKNKKQPFNKLTKQINSHNTNSNIITNSNNVVFNLVNYGKEDLNKIDIKHFINNVVKNNKAYGVKIPEEILKIIHFNPDYPEHNNIYISDINREKYMVYEDNQWKLTTDDKMPEVIDKVIKYSYNKQDELKGKYSDNKPIMERLDVINKYTQFIDTEYLEQLKEEREENNDINNSLQIKRCEEFQKKTFDTLKVTMYNEGVKIKKNKNK